MKKVSSSFYKQDAVTLAQALLGKTLVRQYDNHETQRYNITATEAYLSESDKANHASKGRTARTEVLYGRAGLVYVYLIYGIHWMFNIVSGQEGDPQAVLICGLKFDSQHVKGSGRVGKLLQVDKSFYGEDLLCSNRVWLEDSATNKNFIAKPRKGIDYAGEWKNKLWRFELKEDQQ